VSMLDLIAVCYAGRAGVWRLHRPAPAPGAPHFGDGGMCRRPLRPIRPTRRLSISRCFEAVPPQGPRRIPGCWATRWESTITPWRQRWSLPGARRRWRWRKRCRAATSGIAVSLRCVGLTASITPCAPGAGDHILQMVQAGAFGARHRRLGPGFAHLPGRSAGRNSAKFGEDGRTSWKTYRDYLGLPGDPVRFSDRYTLSTFPSPRCARDPSRSTPWASPLHGPHRRYHARPQSPRGVPPFPVSMYAARNPAIRHPAYATCCLPIFAPWAAGSRCRISTAGRNGAIAESGDQLHRLWARALWKTRHRGGTRPDRWLIPAARSELRLFYRDVYTLSRSDGSWFRRRWAI